MIAITKEDAEFLAGFIDQWLPVCGEKTAERARAVKECLTAETQNMGGNISVTGMPEPLYDGKALIAAIEGAVANGARINAPEYDLSDLAVPPITDDEDPEYAENYWQDGDDE